MKIGIELTDEQAAVLDGIAAELRITREEAAKTYLMEGLRLSTEAEKGEWEIMIAHGIDCVRRYIDRNETPESAFAPEKEKAA
ncbi:hypothetical protein [Puniceicoccus vermicola]|uniref:Ribbon-helix-helix protein, CopG family n=1 Tax=Puniceicoccus vermicola TaxID=388746 RepID=A0A7X1E3Q0_9BACT|nr:hypothetical protein [Puniceicoccus vermicola]MBC2601760.1 hypothetical protein [Puniceicoccus vermicola]